MTRIFIGLSVAVLSLLGFAGVAFAQVTTEGGETPPAAISVVSKDPSGVADQQSPFYSAFVGEVASQWATDLGWRAARPLTVGLYTSGLLMAADAGFYSLSPMPFDRLIDLSHRPTVAVRDERAVLWGGEGGWMVGVNVNYQGDVTLVASSTPPAQTQGSLVHDLALAMLDEMAGSGGPVWLREGLADLLANSKVAGMSEVNQRAAAWHTAAGSGVLPSVSTLTHDWAGVTSSSVMVRDASHKVADQAVFFLSQRVGVPALISVLARASAGEDFEAVLKAVTGFDLSELDNAYRVTMPAY